MRQRPLRAIICGAGAAGCLHALTYRSAGVQIAGVFDPNVERARALADLCSAVVAPTLGALFEIDSEIASLCSPPPAHADQAELACARHRFVFVEKPVATTADDFERIAALGRCVPVLQWRGGRALRAVRAAIDSGHLGPAPSVCGDLAWNRDAAYFEAGRATHVAWGGGVLLSVGVHAIDAICFALGRPLVRAAGSLGHRTGLEVETSAALTMIFAGGALAAIRATFDSGSDATRRSFAGNGAAACIAGAEVDPTAGSVTWLAKEPATLRAMQSLEEQCSGGMHPPLLVPFLHDAVAALERGAVPGDCDALPSMASTRPAHAAVFSVYDAHDRKNG